MANEYLIPIGIDFNGQQELQKLTSTMEQFETSGGQVGKTIEESFSKGVKASQEFDKSVKSSSKNLEAMREAGKVMGKELSDAFKKGDTSEIEKAVSRLQNKMSSITANVEIEIPDDKIRIFENQVEQAKDGIEQLNVALNISKEILSGLDPNSAEFQQLSEAIVFTETTLNEFANEVTETTEKSKSMKAQLREITNELNALEDSGQTNTARFRELQIEAGKLKDQIGDTSAQVAILASDTKHVDALIDGVTGLVGAFTAVQGATALFGSENEELEQALLKVNGAMAILQGLQAVQNTLNKDSAFNVVFLSKAKTTLTAVTTSLASAMGIEATATGGATLATKAFSFALKTIGIGLIITAIALLVEYWDELSDAVNDFLPSGTSVGKVFNQIKSYAFGVGNAILQYVIAPIKALWTTLKTGDVSAGLAEFTKGLNVAGNFNKAFNEQNTRNAKNEALKQKQIRLDQWKDNLEIQEKEGKDVTASKRKWYQNQLALDKKNGKDTKELQREFDLWEAGNRGQARKQAESDAKQRSADAKKASEDARKQAEEDRKERIENEKKANEQLKKFTEELSDAKIQNIKDTAERERQTIADGFNDKIEAIKDEVALTKEAEKAKADLILELQKQRDEKLKEYDDKILKEKLQLQLDAEKQLTSLKKDSVEKEIELLNISAKETENAIKEKFKNEQDLQTKLLEANEKNRFEKEKEIRDKYAQQALKDEEERALLSVELMSLYADKSEETELQKQIALRQIKLNFAEQNLQLLLDSGKGENDLEVLRAKKIVQDAQDAVDEAVEKNNNKPFDLLDFLGLGKGLGKEQKDNLKNAINESMEVLQNFTSFMIDQYDQQIEKKQESIDQLDDEISDLEDRLDEERELQENGFANNVELIEAEIAEKQRQKDEEIKQQKELLENRKAMQKAQIALDTASQLSSLITASTNIFKGFSEIPIVGIPLAIAMIGLMFGTFVASKLKAIQAVNNQKFRHGGWIGGKSHEEGGNKFFSANGDGIEHEKGEFVVKKESAKKYGRLLEAMNDDNFNGITTSDAEVVSLFKQLGFDVDLSSAKKNGQELQIQLLSVGYSIKEGQTLAEINEGIQELIRMEKDTPKSWSDGVFNFVKKGHKIEKTRILQPIKEDNDNGQNQK